MIQIFIEIIKKMQPEKNLLKIIEAYEKANIDENDFLKLVESYNDTFEGFDKEKIFLLKLKDKTLEANHIYDFRNYERYSSKLNRITNCILINATEQNNNRLMYANTEIIYENIEEFETDLEKLKSLLLKLNKEIYEN